MEYKKSQENELELLGEKISLEEANEKLRKIIEEKDDALSKLNDRPCYTNYECSENVKQKLIDYKDFKKEHKQCSEKIRELESKLNNACTNQVINNDSESEKDFNHIVKSST